MKKTIIKLIVISFLVFLFLPKVSWAHGEKVLYLFYSYGCPHCSKEELFLESYIEPKYPQLEIKRLEVSKNRENARVLSEAAKRLGVSSSGVPVTIVSDKVFVGYQSDSTTGARIEAAIREYLDDEKCEDFVLPILKSDGLAEEGCSEETPFIESSHKVNLPLLGDVDAKAISLPLFTLLVAGMDGFNPCAMWVLIFLISLLLGMEDKKKMWILGSAFILSSGVVYFLFLSAWLNLFLFLGFVFWIRLVIGLVALLSGAYHIKEFFANKAGQCEVVDSGGKKKIIEKLKKIVSTDKFYLALGGIILLAAAINMVELVCSAGLPAVYTQVLALSDMPRWKYYGYLLFYVTVFMLDDMLIFIIAMKTLRLKGVSSKYTRYSGVVGGFLMLVVGLLLLFKPEWLMFG